MTRYKQNEYGIEAFEIRDIYIPDIDSDDDPIYELIMETNFGDIEIYCSSAYESNLENIKIQLEKQFNLDKKETGYKHKKKTESILEKNRVYENEDI